jgi:glycosyltransferase involved in cell wall biosynthesis
MLNVAGGLAAKGYEVEILLANRESEKIEIRPGVSVTELGVTRIRRSIPGLVRYLRSRSPACLLATLNNASVAAIVARALARTSTPTLVRVANTLSERSTEASTLAERATFFLARRLYRRADLLIAPSRGVAEDLVATAGIDRGTVRVIPNPTLEPTFRDLAKLPIEHQWLREGSIPVILGVGRLVPQKDFATLLRAFSLVRQNRPCRLIILGEGPERVRLTALSDSLGVGEDVDLPGFDPNPYPYFASAGVFVLSSRFEGLPGALIQALACGTPIVSTDCPSGPSEILGEGAYGRLVPVGDPETMANAILETLSSPPIDVPDQAWASFTAEEAVAGYEEAILAVTGPPLSDRWGAPASSDPS